AGGLPIQKGQPHPNRSREWRLRADGIRLVSPCVHTGQARAGHHLSQRAVSLATPVACGELRCRFRSRRSGAQHATQLIGGRLLYEANKIKHCRRSRGWRSALGSLPSATLSFALALPRPRSWYPPRDILLVGQIALPETPLQARLF